MQARFPTVARAFLAPYAASGPPISITAAPALSSTLVYSVSQSSPSVRSEADLLFARGLTLVKCWIAFSFQIFFHEFSFSKRK
jgi:hypothetical protein